MTDAATIMVVDDDRAFCAALAGALRRRGMVTVIAHDHDEALSEADAWRPQRAVVDLRMPGRSGLELVASLREKLPDIQVVVLTGFECPQEFQHSVHACLTKPAETRTLISALVAACAARR